MAKRRSAVRPKKSLVSVEGAEFFKVFIPSLSSHQLMIPPDFTKNFRKTMKDKVILKDIDGKTWYVDVKEIPNGVYLMDGWQRFVDHHGLKVGEFLVFRYDGSYSFVVQIFGINGCKKEMWESKNIVTDVKSEEETNEEMKPKQTSRKRAPSQDEDHLSSVDRRSKRLKRFGEANEIHEEVGASEQPENSKKFENEEQVATKCPFFVSPPSASRYTRLRIPEEVMNNENVHLEEEMMLRDAKGKVWPVRIFRLPDGATFIGKGLYAFRMENNVGPKDSCKFTFGAQKFTSTINVHVLRNSNKFLRT